MRGLGIAMVVVVVAGCGSGGGGGVAISHEPTADPVKVAVATVEARLPAVPGKFGPSLLQVDGAAAGGGEAGSTGAMLSDVDSCATCHPDAAKQWSTSAHSFASFGNPIYRVNVELARKQLGADASQHCGGCHDMPLMIDGLMTNGKPVPAADLRAHSGVTCRLCHGIESTTKDGNGSYVWNATPLDAPVMGDAGSIAKHVAQVRVKPEVGTELCVGCHRGFLSADMGMPVHLTGLDEPGMWRNSAWTGNGMGRVDKVEQKTCIACHMEKEDASADEYGAKAGKLASHRFLGGHTWMAAMRGDADHLARTQAKLVGAASIDVLPWKQVMKPSEGKLEVDVVVRNLLAGHRFPGGVLDIQDTWIEVELADAKGVRLAESGLRHETDAKDQDTHVLRTLVVDERGEVLEEHEMADMRTQIATQTIAAREAQVVRYAFALPKEGLRAEQWPLVATARLRHRARTLAMQDTVCRAAKTPEGKAFIAGARGARSVALDPCRAQPITLIAETRIELGAGARAGAERHVLDGTGKPGAWERDPRATWERDYEHGMALVATVSERLEEARGVLETALAEIDAGASTGPGGGGGSTSAGGSTSGGASTGSGGGSNGASSAVLATPELRRARAMVLVQLAWVADKQGRADDALALVAEARGLLPAPAPAVLEAVATDALARVWRWQDAIAPAKACTERAPQNTTAWMMYARVLGSVADDEGALAAATTGLAFAPRDPDLLRSQATALAGLHRPEAAAALAAYDRFRSPDYSAELRIECAADSPRCAREREQGHTHILHAIR